MSRHVPTHSPVTRPPLPAEIPLLPAEARKVLMRAARIEPELPRGCSRERALKLDRTVAAVRERYPQFFKGS